MQEHTVSFKLSSHPSFSQCLKVQEVHSQSVTATAQRHHVIILLQNHILLIIEIQQADGLQSVGDTAGWSHFIGRQLERVHDGAHRGMVGRSEVPPKWERAGTSAVVGVVTAG